MDVLLFCSIIASFLLEYFLYSGGIFLFLFRCICRRCFVFIYLYDLFLWFCLFWACESGVSLAGRVIFSFCVGLRCVECRFGTIYLGASLGCMAGQYGFSSLWLCCGEYGTIYLSAGRGWPAGLYGFSLVLFVSLVFISC